MKRRGFIKAIAAAPAAPALLAQQQLAQQQQPALPSAAPVPAPPAAGRGGFGRNGAGRGAQEVARIELTEPDVVAETAPSFFTPAQFSALRRLSGILMPPLKGGIGALDTDAPEFLDFLIGVSLPDRQALYRNGLDYLNAQARRQFAKAFADTDPAQADKILKPLFVPVAWAYDPPKDPIRHFIFEAHQDIRTATRNAPSPNSAPEAGGRRGFAGGLYWNPIDPV